MNDFTKEELEFIALGIDSITLEDEEIELHHNLFHKLQSMIDSYCEHDGIPIVSYATVHQCNKCGRLK